MTSNSKVLELSKEELRTVEGGGDITLGALTAIAAVGGAIYYAGTVVGEYIYNVVN